MAAPEPSPINELMAVSCTSDTFCVTVGFQEGPTGSDFGTLIESFDGTNWAVVPSPNPAGRSGLFAVSCTNPTRCVAVGETLTPAGQGFASAPLIESWDGTEWTVTPSPSLTGRLSGVSCVSATSCVAVGSPDGTIHAAISEVWDGTQWTVMRSTHVPGELSSVACTSVPRCIAVGSAGALIEQRVGRHWSMMPSPNPGAGELLSVSCAHAQSCVAVGDALNSDGTTSSPAIDSWNGTAWSGEVTPGPGAENTLWSVSCLRTTRCVAVGEWDNTPASFNTLIETWNGSTAKVEKSPNAPTGTQLEYLFGVSCTPTRTCFAVGFSAPGTGVGHPLILVSHQP